MTHGESWRLERKAPLALMLAIAVQFAAVLLWTGRAAARMDALETQVSAQGPVAERLARLEAQGEAARAALERIERRMDDLPPLMGRVAAVRPGGEPS